MKGEGDGGPTHPPPKPAGLGRWLTPGVKAWTHRDPTAGGTLTTTEGGMTDEKREERVLELIRTIKARALKRDTYGDNGLCGCGAITVPWAEENVTPAEWKELDWYGADDEFCDDNCSGEEHEHEPWCECGMCKSIADPTGAYSPAGELIGRIPCGCEDAPCCGC